jgi:hypothetical protein
MTEPSNAGAVCGALVDFAACQAEPCCSISRFDLILFSWNPYDVLVDCTPPKPAPTAICVQGDWVIYEDITFYNGMEPPLH